MASGNWYGEVLRNAAQSPRIKRTSEFGKGAKPNFILNFMRFKSLKKKLTNLKINAISPKKIPALKLKLANFESEKTRGGGALRDETKNGCVGDYPFIGYFEVAQ